MAAPVRLIGLAEHLPVDGEAAVVRPDWMNPAVEGGGSGLEFRTALTLEQLLGRYRQTLIRATYAAQFMVVDCAGNAAPDKGDMPLHQNRFDSDMVPHVDWHHERRGDVTVVAGQSNVLTGMISMPALAEACLWRIDVPGPLHNLKKLYMHMPLREAQGRSVIYAAQTRAYLNMLFMLAHERVDEMEDSPVSEDPEDDRPYVNPEARVAFYEEIRALQEEGDFVWRGQERPREPGRTTAIFLSRMLCHCKGWSEKLRSGRKWRVALIPGDDEKRRIDDRLSGLRHDTPDPVTDDWVLGME